jgi:eukaryotic-like serine/threonine-protein kinase
MGNTTTDGWKDSTHVSSPEVKKVTDPGVPVEVDLTGQTLGNYEITGVVGEGAMGKVYRGRHTRIGRVAAVKVLKEEHAQSTDLVQRFIQEAQAVNAIKNPHIVDVYDFGEERTPDGARRVYCIMELLEGESLADLMDREPLTVQLATKVCCELSQALHAAHQVGVVHRDIKPDNIFLVRREKDPRFTKVLDFGVAKLLKPIGDIPRAGTQAGVVIGTPEYMAPEQALGQLTDARVDLYAVGLVLYEILAGRRPYAGESFGTLVVEITTKPLPPLPEKTPRGESVPPALVQIISKALEKDADRRWQSGEALAQALKPFAEGKTVAATAVPELDELAAVRPSRGPRLAAAGLSLALLAGGAWLALAPGPQPVEPVAPIVAPVVAPTAEPEAEATAVVLDLKSTPAGAKVTRLDTRQLLGTTPLKIELDKSTQPLELQFELDGHETVKKDARLVANVAMSVELPAKK